MSAQRDVNVNEDTPAGKKVKRGKRANEVKAKGTPAVRQRKRVKEDQHDQLREDACAVKHLDFSDFLDRHGGKEKEKKRKTGRPRQTRP